MKYSMPAKYRRPLIIMSAFAIIGALIVLISNAAIIPTSVQPESGARTGNVCSDNDSQASGGGYIKFGKVCTDLFVSTTGSDSNNGTTTALAVKTVGKALSLSSGPTRIRIMAGSYIEQVLIQKNDITIEPYGNGDVTINGAMKEFINGVSGWANSSNGVYRYSLTRNETKKDGSNMIYGADGKQQWTYSNYAQLLNTSYTKNYAGVFVDNNIFGNSDVYVVTNTGQKPTAPLYISSDPTIYIRDVSNVSINSAGNSKLTLMYGSYNVFARNGNNIKIDGLDVVGGQNGINAYDSSNVAITNNTVRGAFNKDWDWADVKEGDPITPNGDYSPMENSGIFVKPSGTDVTNVTVDNNKVNGYFNGINFGGTTSRFIDNSVVSNNIISDNNDDGIEIDSYYRNLVIKGNVIYDAYSPFSSTSGRTGPIYVYENVIIANREVSEEHYAIKKGPGFPLKMNNIIGPANKNLHFYYNTFYYKGHPRHKRYMVHTGPGTETSNVSFTNNIFYSYGGGLIMGSGRAQDNVNWDGNLFYSVKDDPNDVWDDNYWSWNSYYNSDNTQDNFSSLSQIIAAGKMPSQWQGNIEGNPAFNCVVPATLTCFRATSAVSRPASKQLLPGAFADSGRLNGRTRVGAFE